MANGRSSSKHEARLTAKAAQRIKDDHDGTTFLRVPHVVLDSPGFRLAEHASRSFLMDLAGWLRRPGQDRGLPNGALLATRERMASCGWKSQGVIQRAIADLIACGLIVETRKGHKHSASLYAVTWAALDIDGTRHLLDIAVSAWPRAYRGSYLRPAKQARARAAPKTQTVHR